MKLDTRKCVKYIILVFLIAFGSIRSNFSRDEQVSYLVLKNDIQDIQRRIQEIVEKVEASEGAEETEEEEKLLKDLWDILGRFYKKIIEVMALYWSGYYPDSYKLYDQILIEIGRDLIHLGKILAWYLPMLINNPHISWRVKVKKCAYVSSALVVVTLWMKELYKYNKNRQKQTMQRSSFDHLVGESDYYSERYARAIDERGDIRPRLRPRDI